MKYDDILNKLIYKFKSESEMTRAILRVSNNFTSERENIKDYLSDEVFVSAYSAFYFPTNLPKFDQVVKKVPTLIEILKDAQVIEIGAGPGSFSFSIAKYTNQTFYAVETSALMRQQANIFRDSFYSNLDIEFLSNTKSIPDRNDKKRIVIFTNSYNEMTLNQGYEYIKDLDADHVLFIEPGTMEMFKSMLPMRDKLIKRKFNVLYPCASNSECPLSDKDDWCHQYLKLDLDLEVKRIAQIVKINRKWQATCIHLYSKDLNNNTDQKVVLRTFPKTKYSKDWQICESNTLKEFSNLKRDYTKDEFKDLEDVLAGDIINYEMLKMLKSGQIRGKVDL